jgi:hypothetical protein
MLDISDATVRYYGTKNSSGEYPDGTWRDIQIGTGSTSYMERQVKISGTWTKQHKSERPV